MLPGKFIPIIKTIAGQCHHLGLTWAFTGSLNLVMWGFDLEPHDIDLETDRYGAEQFDLLNADRAVWALQLRQSEVMQSWFARYDFDGVQVEVMGDCRYHRPNGCWVVPQPLDQRIRWEVRQGLNLPLLNLADEQEICKLMGRHEKAECIRAWLADHSVPTGINGISDD
jgi:hypothetical protein